MSLILTSTLSDSHTNFIARYHALVSTSTLTTSNKSFTESGGCRDQISSCYTTNATSTLKITYKTSSPSLFVALGLQTVPIVCDVVTHTADLVVGVGVSLILVVGRTPTVISAFPFPCWPSTTIKVLPKLPNGKPAAVQAL